MKNKFKKIACATATMALVAAMGLAGCSGNSSSSSASDSATTSSNSSAAKSDIELQVFAANSLQKALPEVQELYTDQTGVTFKETQFKGSGELNEMLGAGQQADIEITASKGTMDTAVEKGYVDEKTRVDMFTNELVIVAKADSDLKDVTLQDIADGKYTVCVGDDSVPAGNYAAQALSTVGAYQPSGDEAGKTGKDISGKNGSYVGIDPAFQNSVGNVCKAAGSGQVDVAIVYSSDAVRFGSGDDAVKVVGNIPDSTHKPIVYPGAVCSESNNADAADAFIRWCLSDPDAIKIFNEWGFELAE